MILINTDELLDKALNEPLTLILSKTRDCGVCTAIKGKLIPLIDDYKDIPFYEIYIEDFPKFQGQHLIFTVPTVIILENGKEILRESRFVNIKKIDTLLNSKK